MIEPERAPMKIRHMRFACRITKATDTHSEYVILFAFRQQQLERVSKLRLCLCCNVVASSIFYYYVKHYKYIFKN